MLVCVCVCVCAIACIKWRGLQTPNLPQQSEAAVNKQLDAKHTFLHIIPMKLSNGHTFIETNALLDCGSDTTLLRKETLKKNRKN